MCQLRVIDRSPKQTRASELGHRRDGCLRIGRLIQLHSRFYGLCLRHADERLVPREHRRGGKNRTASAAIRPARSLRSRSVLNDRGCFAATAVVRQCGVTVTISSPGMRSARSTCIGLLPHQRANRPRTRCPITTISGLNVSACSNSTSIARPTAT